MSKAAVADACGSDDSVLLQEIRESVAELAKRGGIRDERAFAAWYAIVFHEIEEDEALEASSLDGGEDGGIDLFHVDDTNERVLVLQGGVGRGKGFYGGVGAEREEEQP
jgi:hypothetical protein